MDRLDRLELFTRIVEGGSFARAAQELRVARSTATNAINLLEKPPYWEYIIIGGVLLLGVMIDELGRLVINAVRTRRRRSLAGSAET